MRMKLIAGCGFLLNTIFFATYYSVTKEALSRIDPIVFTFFEMVSLAPAGLLIILCSWKNMSRVVVKRGILLGSTLCLALFTIAIALKYTTATSTAFFPALNGFVAAMIAWGLFREPVKSKTWLAGVFSLTGAALLIFTASAGAFRGTLIAFLGGLFYTGYVFLSDYEQKDEQAHWPLFGIELLTTAAWACLVALLFGDWQAVHPNLPKDVWVVLYVSTACTFVPTLITVLLQNYISPVTVSFIYILEPVLGAIIANLYLGEVLSVQGYIGGGLVVLGALINTWGTIGQDGEKRASKRTIARGVRGSWVSSLLYPGIGCLLGSFLLYHLGGLPPASWNEVYHVWPQLSQYLQQGQKAYVVLLLVQAGGWLIAWISVLLMGCLALLNLLRFLLQPAQPRQVSKLDGQQKTIQSAQAVHNNQPVRNRPGTPLLSRTHISSLSPQQPKQYARTAEQPALETPVTERLSLRPAPRARTTGHLPEHLTWYGQAVWGAVPAAMNGPVTPNPFGEPLRHEPTSARQMNMLEAEKRLL